VHHRTVERLAAGDSPIHRLDPRVKLVSVLVFVICVSLLPKSPMFFYLAPAGLVIAILALARLPLGFVFSRTLLVLPFVGLVALFLPFTRGPTELFHLEGLGLSVYAEGLELAAAILAKGVLAILAVESLVFTTRFHRLLLAMRWLRVPRAVVAILGFLFRYLDLLSNESLRVQRARRARTPGRTRRLRGRSTGGMVGRLLLRTLGRAERIHRAMVARGFDGEIRTL